MARGSYFVVLVGIVFHQFFDGIKSDTVIENAGLGFEEVLHDVYQRMGEIEKTNAQLRKESENLREENAQIREEYVQIKKQVSVIKKKQQSDHSFQANCSFKNIERRVPESVVGSAFFAKPSAHVSNVQDNQQLVFDGVITKVGTDYDPSTGEFTCTIPGTYVFHHTMLAFPSKHVETVIVKNGAALAYVYAAAAGTAYESSSATAVTKLQKGDRVFVRINGKAHSGGGGNDIDWPYTAFSGFLLYPQND